MKTTHYSYDVLAEVASASPCGVYSDKHDYSERDEEVTCRKCLNALGYAVEGAKA